MIRKIKLFIEIICELYKDPEFKKLNKEIEKAFIELIFYLSFMLFLILWGLAPFLWSFEIERMLATLVVICFTIHSFILT